MALLAASGISKSYSARLLFDGVSFEIAPRDKVGLVGVNGCGKTTLFRILTGEEAPDTGSVMKHKGARMGFMRQNVENTSDTLYQSTVAAFDHLIRIEQELERISEEISNGGSDVSSLISHQQSLNERYEREGGLTFRSRVRSTLLGLGFTESEFAKPLSDMSGGERNKAQLAKLLLSGAELLLLDEPTNHLDIQSVTWLEDFLKSYAGAFIVISHDRYFLDRVTNRTLEIKNGKLTATKKLRGKMEACALGLMDHMALQGDYDTSVIYFVRSSGLPLSVQQAAEKHARELGFESFRWYDTQNVITSHCGPGSFAVAFPGIRK